MDISEKKKKDIVEIHLNKLYGWGSNIYYSRSKISVMAKRLAWYLLYHKYYCSYDSIGRMYDRDHSTVMHGVKNIDVEVLKQYYEDVGVLNKTS